MYRLASRYSPHEARDHAKIKKRLMLRVGLVGISIHQAPLELLSALTISREERATKLPLLAEVCGFEELAYVATCNRVEFLFKTRTDQSIARSRNLILDFFFRAEKGVPFQPENFYTHSGIEAVRHLFTVSASLDSLVIGEAQILGQIKEAFADAEAAELVGEEMGRLFQAAFRCAKKVRRDTELGAKRVSIINLASATIRDFVADKPTCTVAIVGMGPMTGKLAETFRSYGVKNLIFVNRTKEKATRLAHDWEGTALSLDEFLSDPPRVDAVCSSTGSGTAIFGREEVERLLAAGDVNRPLFILDLAIPRDVTTDVEDIANVRVYHLGSLRELSLKNRRERFQSADHAREIVDAEVLRYHKQVVEDLVAPLFSGSKREAMTFAESGLDALFARKLEGLDDGQKEAIRYWVVRKLVPSVLHMPMKAIVESIGLEDWNLNNKSMEADYWVETQVGQNDSNR